MAFVFGTVRKLRFARFVQFDVVFTKCLRTITISGCELTKLNVRMKNDDKSFESCPPFVDLKSYKKVVFGLTKVQSPSERQSLPEFCDLFSSYGGPSTSNSMQNVCFYSHSNAYSNAKDPTKVENQDRKPSWEQLQHICLRLSDTMPKFLKSQSDYTFYREDIIFVNNITKNTTRGLQTYRFHLSFFSFYLRFRYPFVEFQLLNVTPFIDEGIVRARWRIIYKTWFDIFYSVAVEFKFSIAHHRKTARWFDAYSVFYVGNDGLVFKHVVDRVMPDEGKATNVRPRVSFLSRLLGGSVVPKTLARVKKF